MGHSGIGASVLGTFGAGASGVAGASGGLYAGGGGASVEFLIYLHHNLSDNNLVSLHHTGSSYLYHPHFLNLYSYHYLCVLQHTQVY